MKLAIIDIGSNSVRLLLATYENKNLALRAKTVVDHSSWRAKYRWFITY